jgi:PAS domain S-box-containing protein
MMKNVLRPFKIRTLTRDLAVGLVLIVTIILFLIGAANYFLIVTQMEQDLTLQAHDLANKLASILSFPVWTLDTDAVEQITIAYQDAENVAGIRVLDAEDRVLYDRPTTESRLINAQQPIYYGNGLIGSVQVSISAESIASVSRNILVITLATVFLVVITELIAIRFLLRKFLVRPLEELILGINSIADGNYSHELLRAPQAEIDGIIQRVNAMSRQIAEREAALQQSEAQFRLLAENSTDMISRHTPEGAYLYASPACRALLGYEPEELVGHSALEFIHPEDVLMVEQFRSAIITQPMNSSTLFRARQKRGDYVWLETNSHTILDTETGAVREIHAASRNVTARKLVEESLRQSEADASKNNQLLRSIFESPRGIIIFSLDPQYRYTAFTVSHQEAMKSIWGVKIEIGMSMLDAILRPDDREKARLDFDRALQGEHFIIEEEYGNEARQRVWWENRYGPIYNEANAVIGLTVFVVDIAERRQADEALKKSEAMYQSLVETSQDLIWQCDAEGRYAYLNPAWEQVFGYKIEEMLGKKFTDFQSPEIAERDQKEFTHLMQGNKVTGFETSHLGRDGNEIYLVFNAKPVTDETGVSVGALGTAYDITARKQAEDALRASEARYRQAITAAGAVPYYRDYQNREQTYTFIGDGIFHLTGYPATEITPAIFDQLEQECIMRGSLAHLTPEEAGKLSEVEDIQHWTCDYRILTRDGQTRWVSDAAVQVRDENQQRIGVIGILQDITERKQAGERILQLNADLERRVAERTAQLESANKELEAFSYSVSHDLRAPLRAIHGFSRMLQEEYAGQLPEPGLEMVDKVRASARRMSQLIDDLLRFSRFSRQALTIQTIQPLEIVQQGLSGLKSEQEGRSVEVVIGELPACQGDESLLTQVWVNLLSNALKYTRKRPIARIEIGCQAGENGALVYFVRDNGTGFDMRYADKLFGVFQRLHSENEFEGTGVGLALVQRILQRHGGRIWVEAAPNQGATFYFTLPVKQ